MRRENTPWRPVEPASLQWNDADEPSSTEFGDVYYSRDNGLEESRYVFVQGNDLPQRWRRHSRRHFCIVETGFGTGLNFLLTWQAWRELPKPRPELHYLSIEKHPLAREDLVRALANWPTLESLATTLLDHYPGLLPGQHRVLLNRGRITLDLWWEDVAHALPDLASQGRPLVDAWYLDGFAPACNAAMWSRPVLRAAARLSHPQASFATFTAAGQVRRDLTDAGFEVRKAPGFERKRECLRGHIKNTATAPEPTTYTPWDISGTVTATPARVLVVGGGLAGCTVAAALSRRGISVTLLEKGKLANAGSGNDQGILYTRLSRKHSSLTDFALQSFRFASQYYRSMFQSDQLTTGLDGALCGSFHQSDNSSELIALGESLALLPELAQVLDAQQAEAVLGIAQPSAGYWYPGSGWLRPVSVCRALVDAGNIEVIENCAELTLETGAGEWRAMVNGSVIASAPCAVVATGTAAATMRQLAWLPVQAIRGQTTHLPTASAFAGLRAALCHKGYIAPAREGVHCIGATFDLHDDEQALRESDHHHNLASLADAVPDWRENLAAVNPGKLGGRVGYRCASPDYLPMVGPAPDVTAFLRDYAPLRKNARQTIALEGEYIPGLYLTTAHGSRGLTSAPLAAELLASTICGEPAPLSRELCRAVAPARFIMRDLARGRI
ncbi:MAG: bifunctional tRNA (5-methylaminomethyl-2-thiouridine)(34)-methyltransferase MnmD/FAD-dependent 5-carboxymethylaminomethyl-2-thiouridine(34) oxidoreductase MnmC [Gammaproteobacteria bacterium]|nr:MAG: bifunctional tRNA (5-methylaminomethyl-2-thiouridine)(34)-methyltransferase MnmD/FAD-dependent 5-carboxymethylaminomethyl-2-thiouridine(34) oxidoreductase MnmC [Gammaproteobacteria bacterium]RLA61816.1 MAG: bifunctional tRNA (5-methylaminomethyl-2-thiouridine)(34)-methyltransferase MnmD/FAD-dependent 5-carboxymethylaminomethyl-2-thiouridine(34) oxidoreductase MnmC [Gammaproteobacteria bacterium]